MAQASIRPAPGADAPSLGQAPSSKELPPLGAAGPKADAAESPARVLQARLEAEMALEPKMSARSVTVLVISVSLATWFAGFLLYASL
jgi:hypothetical protein